MNTHAEKLLKLAGVRLPSLSRNGLHPNDETGKIRAAEIAVSRRRNPFPAQPAKAETPRGHECRRFKTAFKTGGKRILVACRECGARVMTSPLHDISGPVAALP